MGQMHRHRTKSLPAEEFRQSEILTPRRVTFSLFYASVVLNASCLTGFAVRLIRKQRIKLHRACEKNAVAHQLQLLYAPSGNRPAKAAGCSRHAAHDLCLLLQVFNRILKQDALFAANTSLRKLHSRATHSFPAFSSSLEFFPVEDFCRAARIFDGRFSLMACAWLCARDYRGLPALLHDLWYRFPPCGLVRPVGSTGCAPPVHLCTVPAQVIYALHRMQTQASSR